MNELEWIVCERTDRWAAALRVILARQVQWRSRMPRLYEVRSLAELASRLELRPDGLGLISVDNAQVPRVLSWLAGARMTHPRARFIALLEGDLSQQDVGSVLLEAGAADIILSPRHLQHVLPLAWRHAMAATARARTEVSSVSLVDAVWSTLPWQSDEREVR